MQFRLCADGNMHADNLPGSRALVLEELDGLLRMIVVIGVLRPSNAVIPAASGVGYMNGAMLAIAWVCHTVTGPPALLISALETTRPPAQLSAAAGRERFLVRVAVAANPLGNFGAGMIRS